MSERLPSPNKTYPFVGPNYQKYGEVKGYVYYPYNDSYYVDPNAVKSQYEAQGLLKKEQKPSLVDQVLPIVASNGAYYGGKILAEKAGNAWSNWGKSDASAGTSGGATPIPNAPASSPIAAAPSAAPIQDATGAAASAAPAGELIGPEQPTDWMGSAGNAAQGAYGAYQVYQGAKDFKKDKVGGLLGVGSGAANVGQALGSSVAADVAAPLAVASGGYNTLKSWQHGGEGIRGSMGTLGAGLGTIFIGPGLGTLVGAAAGSAIGYGLDKSGVMHQTTIQKQQDRWGKLAERGVPNAEAAYQANHGQGDGTWESGKYAGQKWSFERAQDLARQDPTHFQHVYGNYDTFGTDWSNYTDEQQKAITAGLVSNGLYKSNKGDVVVADKTAAMKIKDQVLAGAPPEAAKPSGKPADKPSMIQKAPFKQPMDKTKLKGLLGV